MMYSNFRLSVRKALSHSFRYETCWPSLFHLSGFSHILLQHFTNFFLLRSSRHFSWSVRGWIYGSYVWWCQLIALRGCIHGSKMLNPHSLTWLQHLMNGISLYLLLSGYPENFRRSLSTVLSLFASSRWSLLELIEMVLMLLLLDGYPRMVLDRRSRGRLWRKGYYLPDRWPTPSAHLSRRYLKWL